MRYIKEKTSIIFFLFAVFLTSCVSKQIIWPVRYVTGTVHDKKDRPLSGVTVTTIPPSQTVVSDRNGNFTLMPNVDGDYVIKTEKPGYHSNPVGIGVSGPVILWSDGRIEPIKIEILMVPENEPLPKEKISSAPPPEEKMEADETVVIVPGFGFLEEKKRKVIKSKKSYWSR